MKILTCISAFFLLGIAYGQQGNNQERLDQLPPAVTETEVERDAKAADKERGEKKDDKQESKQTDKAENTGNKQTKEETQNTINTSNRKSSKTPEKQ